jgi:hypothetical protein
MSNQLPKSSDYKPTTTTVPLARLGGLPGQKKSFTQRVEEAANQLQMDIAETRKEMGIVRDYNRYNPTNWATSYEISRAIFHIQEEEKQAAKLKAEEALKIKAGNYIYKMGSTYSTSGLRYTVRDPKTLTEKQDKAVGRIAFYTLGIFASEDIKALLPFIDVVFALKEGRITEATFADITGVTPHIDMFDDRSDHNL